MLGLRLVVLTGAGVSAESGLKTFRDHDGLWEGYSIEDVATPGAWERDPELVLRFYNERRRALRSAQANSAHLSLAALEDRFQVDIVTQNVDDLHERAGSTRVLHLHGELTKARSSKNSSYLIDLEGRDIALGDCCPEGHQLRPHVVWFGEAVPMMEAAARLVRDADVLLVVGTSLVVYPAASLLTLAPRDIPIYVVDPIRPSIVPRNGITFFEEPATIGVKKVCEELLATSPTRL